MTKTIATKDINGHTVEIREHEEYRDKVPKRNRKYDIYINGELDLKKRVNNGNRKNPEGLMDVAERRVDAINFKDRAETVLEKSELIPHRLGGYGPSKDGSIRIVIGSGSVSKNIGEKDKIVRVLENKVKRTYKNRSMPQRKKPRSWQRIDRFSDLTELEKYIEQKQYL